MGTENFDTVVDQDASGGVLVRRMFGSGFDEVLSRADASGVRWYGTDRLGTVHEWFDASGVRVGAVVQFDGYGTVVSGALSDRYGFTGREWDSVVGLQYSRARMYSPTQGRFTSEDPMGLRAGDANFYRYVGNQPTGRVDPSGYDWIERFQNGWDNLGKGFQELPAASERAANQFGERLDNLAHGRLNPDFVNGLQKLRDDPAKNSLKLAEIIVDDMTKAPRKLGEGIVTGDGRKIVEGAAGTGLMYFGAKQAGELVCRDSDKFLKFLKSEKGKYPNAPRTGGPQAPTAGKFPNCFPAETVVGTEHGLRPIQDVRAADRVWAFDLVAGEWKLRRVMETYRHDHDGDMVAATVAGEVIESTGHHPWWAVRGEDLDGRPQPEHVPVNPAAYNGEGRWVDAMDLRVGDVLLLRSGEQAAITALVIRHAQLPVYNFHVEELHCYAVGGVQVLVHNNSMKQMAKDLLDGKDVRVKTIKESDKLLRTALPDAKKITGTGPGQSGPPDWTKFKGKDPNGMYHKDYHFDPDTGRIYGHGPGNPHGDFKHINIKLPDGSKVTIIIEPK